MGYVRSCSRKTSLEARGRHVTGETCSPSHKNTYQVRFSQEELVDATAFRYITDAITRDEAIALLKAKEAGKKDRETTVRELG